MGLERTGRRPLGRVIAGRLALVICGCLLLRGAAEGLESVSAGKISEGLGAAALALELPGTGWGPGSGDSEDAPGGAAVKKDRGEREKSSGGPDSAPAGESAGDGTDLPGENTPGDDADVTLRDGAAGSGSAGEAAPQMDAVGTTITGTGGGYTPGGEGIYLKNRTDYQIRVEDYLEKPLEYPEGSAVLIIHTHGSEAYNPAGEDIYVPSDPSRTVDREFNVVRVGDELERVLEARGITVYHDRELYDYPVYVGSYERALEGIKAQLEAHPEIAVVIDLHRDALEADDGTVYKTVADIGDTPCAQVMLICGTNFSGLKHPDWRENLGLAMKLQRSMTENYPTLARPLKISENRYNQHMTHGSLIAEVGTNGNTLQEALTAVRYFGECLAQVLNGENEEI